MKYFYYIALTTLFFSCQEKKSYNNVNADSLLAVPTVVKKDYCVNGQLPAVLDTFSYPTIVLENKENSRTLLYLMANEDSLAVTISGCDKPSYQYVYSTKRYYRGIEELRFFYNAVNSFYRMMDKKHQPKTYAYEDLTSAVEVYLKQNKTVTLSHPVRFSSNGRSWIYKLNNLEDENEGPWRRVSWSVVSE